MQLSSFAVLTALVASVVAAPQSSGPSWYDSDNDVTCTTGPDGAINCEKGHSENARSLTDVLAERSQVESGLEKRWCAEWWCSPDCYAKGYCNAFCGNGVCNCKNKKQGRFCFNDK